MPVTYELLRERVAGWTAPFPDPRPAGVPSTFSPEYEAVAREVAKLDTPTGGAVDWKRVVEGAGQVLASRSKDMMMAACLAQGLFVTQGLPGLITGATLLSELIALYWETMQPDVKRLRGRANVLQWYVGKVASALQGELPEATPDDAEALQVVIVRLAEASREKLANLTPAFGAIIEAVARLNEAAAAPPPAPAQAEPAAGQDEAEPAREREPERAPRGAPAAPAPAPVPTLSEGGDLQQHLGDLLIALVDAGRAMRRSNSADPSAYRVMRAGLWLAIGAEPAAGKKGRTNLPAPEDAWRGEMQQLLDEGRWDELLARAEAMAVRVPLWMDAQRMSWHALSGLGESHQAARGALEAEVRALLARLPGLAGLSFEDGSPVADERTRSWIEELQERSHAAGRAPELAGDSPAPPARPRASPPVAESAADQGAAAPSMAPSTAPARQLLEAGRVGEALACTRDAIMSVGSERERFRLRLEAASMYREARLRSLARATYEELDRESQARGLDAWEPQLAAACLKGLIAVALEAAEEPRGAGPDLATSYRRLCRLDPEAAQEVWP